MLLIILISIFFGSALGLFAGGIVASGSEKTVSHCDCDTEEDNIP